MDYDNFVGLEDAAVLCEYWLTDGQRPSEHYYYHYDGLGSVVALSDEFGDIVETYEYDVFGKPSAISSVGNPYLFTGRRYDAESETYDYRNRVYKPSIGRFLQTDPIGYSDGINWYIYCRNNPINFFDPFGLDTIGVHSNYAHSWITYTTDNGVTKDYGLWHMSRERTKLRKATRLKGDVWTNASNISQATASRYYNDISNIQKAKFEEFIGQEHFYRKNWIFPTNNCASFASDAIGHVIGEDVDADSWRLGLEHPDEMVKSIRTLEARNPTQLEMNSFTKQDWSLGYSEYKK